MFTKFLNLEPEKRERIINAAMKEFGKKGYKNASTDEIVKEAGISKGALFHYFKNKQNLYWYLYDYAVELANRELLDKVCPHERDLLKRIREIVRAKMELSKVYPDMFRFSLSVNFDDFPENRRELEEKNREAIRASYQKIIADADYSMFRDDIDAKKAVEIIWWTMEGFSNKEQPKFYQKGDDYDFQDTLNRLDDYFQLLGDCLYKEKWTLESSGESKS